MLFSGARSLEVLEARPLRELHSGGVSESLNCVKTFTYVCILLAERTAGFPKRFRTTVRGAAVGKCHRLLMMLPFEKSHPRRSCVCGLRVSHAVNMMAIPMSRSG